MPKHTLMLGQCKGRHLEAEMLGLKRILLNQVWDPNFKVDVPPNSVVLHLCTAWVTGEGRKVLFIKTLQTGSEQKYSIVPWDKNAMWTASDSLWKTLRKVGEHRNEEMQRKCRGNAVAPEQLPCSQSCNRLHFFSLYQVEVDRYLAQLTPLQNLGSSLTICGIVYVQHSLCYSPSKPVSPAYALFPSWTKKHSFLPRPSVSGNLTFIPPLPASSWCLPATLAVQPAEDADVWIWSGT